MFLLLLGSTSRRKMQKNRSYIQCDFCDRTFSDIKRHINSVHKKEKFPCTSCDKVSFKCDICDIEFKSRYLRTDHITKVHQEGEVKKKITNFVKKDTKDCQFCHQKLSG